MPAIERDDQICAEPVGQDGDRCVNRSEREICIALDEVGDDWPVDGQGCVDLETDQAGRRLFRQSHCAVLAPTGAGGNERQVGGR
jgi:hypothetical protein